MVGAGWGAAQIGAGDRRLLNELEGEGRSSYLRQSSGCCQRFCLRSRKQEMGVDLAGKWA